MKLVPVEEIPSEIISVPSDDPLAIFKICQEMESLCRKNKGIGLSAVQVGLPWKLFVVDFRDRYRYFVDCEYESSIPLDDSTKGYVMSLEGCLSLPGRTFRVKRLESVKVSGSELTVVDHMPVFVPFEETLRGIYGIVFQHEIDHHRSVLISEIGVELHRCS